jgi:uncharacterized protein (TIGR00730 family)
MKSICVFCGSSAGRNEIYRVHARDFGHLISRNNFTLVYGGGKVGLMGILANAVIETGGKAIGVIPKSIVELEIAHEGLTELLIVNSMSERKQKMAELSDAFVALPGGFGTLDELAEVLTYNQLRIIDKPIGILNINGYFDFLIRFLDKAVHERFVRQEHRNNIYISENATELLEMLKEYKPVTIEKWIRDIKEESSLNYNTL